MKTNITERIGYKNVARISWVSLPRHVPPNVVAEFSSQRFPPRGSATCSQWTSLRTLKREGKWRQHGQERKAMLKEHINENTLVNKYTVPVLGGGIFLRCSTYILTYHMIIWLSTWYNLELRAASIKGTKIAPASRWDRQALAVVQDEHVTQHKILPC